MKKRKLTEDAEELRADRWYYKNMDQQRDNPEQSGLYIILITVSCLNSTYFTYFTYSFSNKCVDKGQRAPVFETQALLSYHR